MVSTGGDLVLGAVDFICYVVGILALRRRLMDRKDEMFKKTVLGLSELSEDGLYLVKQNVELLKAYEQMDKSKRPENQEIA